MDFFSFEHAALRLKETVNIQTDKELGALLGLDVSAFNKRKKRGSFRKKNCAHWLNNTLIWALMWTTCSRDSRPNKRRRKCW